MERNDLDLEVAGGECEELLDSEDLRSLRSTSERGQRSGSQGSSFDKLKLCHEDDCCDSGLAVGGQRLAYHFP